MDDFAGVDDPEFTGWHRIEQILFERGTTEGAAGFADQLDADLATLEQQIQTLEIPPRAVALGAGELVEEVSKGKITGEEDRYSGTDLWDFAANIDGSAAVVDALRPALQERDPALLTEVDQGIASVQEGLEPYRDGSGWLPYASLTQPGKGPAAGATCGAGRDLVAGAGGSRPGLSTWGNAS